VLGSRTRWCKGLSTRLIFVESNRFANNKEIIMADYIAQTRSNYFKVKDEERFQMFCQRYGLELITPSASENRRTCQFNHQRNMSHRQTKTAKQLETLLKRYVEEGTTKQCALRDLLTDLRHFSDAEGLDLFQALDGSYEVYCEERRGQPHRA